MSKPGYVDQNFWIRLVFIVVYWIVLQISVSLFGLLLVILTLIKLGSQYEPVTLKTFLGELGQFIGQNLKFLSFNAEEKPYPFQPWPETRETDHD